MENVVEQSNYLFNELLKIKLNHSVIKEIRGKELLVGVEFISNLDNINGSKFSSYQLNEIAMELGAVFYPGKSMENGVENHHLLIAPPLNVTSQEIDEIIEILSKALSALN